MNRGPLRNLNRGLLRNLNRGLLRNLNRGLLRNLALVLMPTVLAAGWMAGLVVERASRPSLRIAIAGYDPRDLLRGHYLAFRLDLPAADGLGCACLRPNPDDPRRPLAAPAHCPPDEPPLCPTPIGAPRQVYRFYASEGAALSLQKELMASPGSASVNVHFHGDGTVSFSDILTGQHGL
jgi:hypothetical protein